MHYNQQTVHPHHTPSQSVRAYSNARETVQQAVLNETKAYIQRNPSVCKGLSTTACQNFVKRTIVTQPDYTPLIKPLPKLTDVLAKQLVKLGVYQSEDWAQRAAQRWVILLFWWHMPNSLE